MQYTIRNVPNDLDQTLRQRAFQQHKSLNQVAIETLRIGSGLAGESAKQRDLDDIVGTWASDPEIDQALADQRRIDPEIWR